MSGLPDTSSLSLDAVERGAPNTSSSTSAGLRSLQEAFTSQWAAQRCMCAPEGESQYHPPSGSGALSSLTEPLLEIQPTVQRDLADEHLPMDLGMRPGVSIKSGGISSMDSASSSRRRSITEDMRPAASRKNPKRAATTSLAHATPAIALSTADGRAQTQGQAVFEVHLETRRALESSLRPVAVVAEDYYKTEGWCQALARDKNFQNVMIGIIALNAIWIGVDFDWEHNTASSGVPLAVTVINNLFCIAFVFEIAIRFMAFRCTKYAITNAGFVFDSALILLMVWETWISGLVQDFLQKQQASTGGLRSASVLRIFRIFRLLRVARIARLLRTVPEVAILIKGMGQATRSMVVTLTILMLVIYLFAILLTQLLTGTALAEKGHPLSRVMSAMNFMLTQVLCGFDTEIFDELLSVGVSFYVLWLAFVVLAQFTIMNMLIGILCDVVNGAAESQKEAAVMEDMEQQILQLDLDATGEITPEELHQAISNDNIVRRLDQLGVDVSALVDFAKFVMADAGSIPVAEFVEMVAQFRGNKGATVKDIVDLRKFVSMEVLSLWSSVHDLIANHGEDVEEICTASASFTSTGMIRSFREAKENSTRSTSMGQLRAAHPSGLRLSSEPQQQFVSSSASNHYMDVLREETQY